MSKLKTPRDLSVEELLNLLDDQSTIVNNEPIIEYKNDAIEFLDAFKFSHGKYLVKSVLLYRLYKIWSRLPITMNQFNKSVNCFLFSNGNTHNFAFYINKSAKTIALEETKAMVKRNPIKNKNYKDNFNKFLNHYNIEKGSLYLPLGIIFNLYDKYIYETNKKSSLSKKNLSQFLRFSFEAKIYQHQYWFGVNKSILTHLSDELKNALRKRQNNYVEEKKNR